MPKYSKRNTVSATRRTKASSSARTRGTVRGVGRGMQAAGAAANRLGAMSPVPQARLALSAGGIILNSAGSALRYATRPTRRVRPPKKKR